MKATFLKLFASLLLVAEAGVFLILSASLFIPLEAAARKSFSNLTVEFEIEGRRSAIQNIRESQLARNLDLTGDGKPEIVLARRRPNGDILEFGVREVGAQNFLAYLDSIVMAFPRPPERFHGFFDIDGDGTREAIFSGGFESGDVSWDGKDDLVKLVASGNYYYQLKVGEFESTKNILLLK